MYNFFASFSSEGCERVVAFCLVLERVSDIMLIEMCNRSEKRFEHKELI
jgi:hypothetical protein